MLIDSAQKLDNLTEAMEILAAACAPGTEISDRQRLTVAKLIANGWLPEDAVSYIREAGAPHALERIPKKLVDFFDKNTLQLFEK